MCQRKLLCWRQSTICVNEAQNLEISGRFSTQAYSRQPNCQTSAQKYLRACCRPQNGKIRSLHFREEQTVGSWWRKGTPYFQNHTFISWSRAMGAKSIYIYWKSGFLESVTPGFAQEVTQAMFDKGNSENVSLNGLVFQMQVERLGGERRISWRVGLFVTLFGSLSWQSCVKTS